MRRLNLLLDQTMINCVQGFERCAAVNAHNSIGKRESVESARYTILLRNQSKTFLVAVGLNDVSRRHWPALIRVEDGKLVLRTVTASILSFLKMTAQIFVSGRVTSNELDKNFNTTSLPARRVLKPAELQIASNSRRISDRHK